MVAVKKLTAEESIKMMKVYLEEFKELKQKDPEKAREISRKELMEIGVLDEEGKPKKTIVTGQFFGWD